MFSPYLGKLYSDKEIINAIHLFRDSIDVHKCDNPYNLAAESIACGRIIGWFQGRSECGPRALGNRSILADARDKDMKDIINMRIKFREPFRPFAPSVMFEHQTEYFDLDIPSPYMLMIANVLEEKKVIIPSVTHVDGTARLQSVLKELNPEFYLLIQAFQKITGIPIVLNTSFNVNKKPIVETPGDALSCFLKTDLDELYIHNYRIKKR